MPKQSIKYLITLLLIVLSSCFVIHLFFEYLGVLIVSFIIAFSMNPLVHFFERKIKFKKEISVTIVFFLLMGILGFLIFVLGDRLVEEIYSLYKSIPDYILEIKKIVEDIIQRIESLPYNIDVNDAIKNFDYQKYILKFTDTVIDFGKSLPDMIVHFVFSVLFIFFFMLKMDKILSFIESKFQKETYERTKGKLKTILVGYFVAQFKLFLIMFVFLLISFTILNLPYNILLALITSFLDSLPVFGIGFVMWPYMAYVLYKQNFALFFSLLIVYIITQILRRVLEPKIMGSSIGLDTFMSLICLFVGYKFFGAIGLVLGIPIGVLFKFAYQEHLFDNLFYHLRIVWEYLKNNLKTDKKQNNK